MLCLASVVGANGLAYIHTKTKINRAYSRNKSLYKSTFKVLKEDKIKINEYIFPVDIVEVNNLKMLKAFEGIARGLYFYEYKKRFIGKCKVFPTFMNYKDADSKIEFYKSLIELLAKQEQKTWPIRGANPKIFTYQFGPLDQYRLRPMIMTFYEKLKVYSAYMPEGVNLPFSLP